jgi:hypothetical protein
MGDEEDDKGKPDVFKMDREDKLQYLYQVFTHYDKDKSGAIDKEELFKALKFMQIKISRQVTHKLLEEMDEDRSGTVDIEEFLKFFDRVTKFNDMRAVVNRQGAVKKMKDRVMAVYLLAIVIFTFFVVLIYVKSEQKGQELLVTLILACSLFVISFGYIVVFPLAQTTLRGWLAPPVPKEWTDAKKRNAPDVEAAGGVETTEPGRDRIVTDLVAEVPDVGEFEEEVRVTWRRQKEDQVRGGITFELPGMVEGRSEMRSIMGRSEQGKSHVSRTQQSETSMSQSQTQTLALTGTGGEDDDDEERPYRYNQQEIGEATRPFFNPWSQTKARIY